MAAGGGTSGLIFSKTDAFYLVTITNGSRNNIELRHFGDGRSGTGQQTLDSTSATISTGTEYTIRVQRLPRHVKYEVLNGSTLLASKDYDSATDLGDGTFGLYGGWTDGVEFDDFSFTRFDAGQTNLLDSRPARCVGLTRRVSRGRAAPRVKDSGPPRPRPPWTPATATSRWRPPSAAGSVSWNGRETRTTSPRPTSTSTLDARCGQSPRLAPRPVPQGGTPRVKGQQRRLGRPDGLLDTRRTLRVRVLRTLRRSRAASQGSIPITTTPCD